MLLRARVESAMHGFEALLIDVGVNLRRGNIRVTEHFLDDPQIGSVAQQVRGERMSKQMRINIKVDSSALRAAFHNLPDAHRCELRATRREKNLAPGSAADELRALLLEV